MKYCCHTGLSRPKTCRSCAIASGVRWPERAYSWIGSPGSTRNSRKLNVTTASSVRRSCSTFRTRYGNFTDAPPCRLDRLRVQVVRPSEVEDDAARRLAPSRPRVRTVRLELVLVPHDDVRSVLVEHLLHLLAEGDPLGLVELRGLLVVEAVVGLVRVVDVVVPADLAGEHDPQHVVGVVHARVPAPHEDVPVGSVRVVDGVAERVLVHRLEIQLDADLLGRIGEELRRTDIDGRRLDRDQAELELLARLLSDSV